MNIFVLENHCRSFAELSSQVFTEISMTSSHAFLAEHIHKSTMELVSSMCVLDYAKPFFVMYNTISEIHGMLLSAIDQEHKKKALTTNSLVMLRTISEARQTMDPSGDFFSMSTFLLEMLMSGLSVIHSSLKEEVNQELHPIANPARVLIFEQKEFGNPLTDRMKRISKAEVMELHQFCCRGQNCNPSPQSDPPLSSPIFIQSNRTQEYNYEAPYSRPTSSISSTPTYTSDGLQTPFRSRSPMSMDKIVSYDVIREGTPEPPLMASLVSRSSDRVKRKALRSPIPAARSIDESAWTGVDIPRQGRTRDNRLGSMDTTYSLSSNAFSEAASHNAKEASWQEVPIPASDKVAPEPLPAQMPHHIEPQIHHIPSASCAETDPAPIPQPFEPTPPPPPPVPARADSRALMHHLTPISALETDSGNLRGSGRDLPIFRRFERPPIPARHSADTRAKSYSESDRSYLETDTENIQNTGLVAPSLRHLQPSPIPDQASIETESPGNPLSTISYPDTETGDEKHRGEEAPVLERLESSPPPVKSPMAVEDSDPPRTMSIAEDCTLELVTDLRRSPPRVPGEKYPPSANEDPSTPRKLSLAQSVAPKDVEAGLELASAFAAPLAINTRFYPHPERVEPDTISIRPSIKSSGSNRKSKLGFFKKLGGSKNTSALDAAPPLPPNLQACFSICARSLLIWSKRDSDFIVRVSHPFKSGQRVDLGTNSEATNQRKGFSIRLVAASSEFVAAYTCTNSVGHGVMEISEYSNDAQENRIYVVCADSKQHSVLLGEGIPLATSLAISPEKGYIALGCGSSIIIYRIKDGQLQKEYQVGTQIDSSAGSIRFQRLSFSPDSKKLIAATQVSSHSADRQTVYVKIWERFGAEFRNGPVVEDVPLTVVR
jgi:hypothetical protein